MSGRQPHSRELRKGRYSEPGRVYLVTFCCHGRMPVFAVREFAAIVIEEIAHSDRSGASQTLAFVVMPDHVHWVMALGARHRLERAVGQLKGRAAARVNRLRGRLGCLWQSGFHDHAVRAEEDLEAICQYVLHNPVRAGLVERAAEYPFSGLGLGRGRGRG
jgi:putative transposase